MPLDFFIYDDIIFLEISFGEIFWGQYLMARSYNRFSRSRRQVQRRGHFWELTVIVLKTTLWVLVLCVFVLFVILLVVEFEYAIHSMPLTFQSLEFTF